MLKYFKDIRKAMLTKNRFKKYLLYAVGEIVLVVIGILIAIQINSWYKEVQNHKLEKNYLAAIKENLLVDKGEAEFCINYNNHKIAVMDSLLQLLNSSDQKVGYMPYLIHNQRILMSFPTFDPVSIAFDNMTSSHNINMIQNEDLRVLLSRYYNYDWETSPQSVSRTRTRRFANILSEKLIGEPSFHSNFDEIFNPMLSDGVKFNWVEDFSIAFDNANYLEFHKDREALAAMFVMIPTSIYQNNYIKGAIENMDKMLKIIEEELK